MPPAATPSRGPPLCTLLSVSIHPPFHTAQDLSLPCNYLHTQLLLRFGWETHSQNSRRFYILSLSYKPKLFITFYLHWTLSNCLKLFEVLGNTAAIV